MLDHVRYLAKDELAGRESGEPGADSAAAYIEEHFAAYGLTPLFNDATSFRQTFELSTTIRVEPTSRLLFENPVSSMELSLGDEWYPVSYSSGGQVIGRAASVGFGLEAADYDTLKVTSP